MKEDYYKIEQVIHNEVEDSGEGKETYTITGVNSKGNKKFRLTQDAPFEGIKPNGIISLELSNKQMTLEEFKKE